MKRYHPLLVALHWLLAALIIGALIMGGFVLAETPNTDPSKLVGLRVHMGIGLVILALMIARLVTRLVTAKPAAADSGSAALNGLGHFVHVALYFGVIVMSLSGMALSYMAGLPGIVFGDSGVPLPADFSEFLPRAVHGLIAKLLMGLIAAHIAGFAYHQFLRRDGLFARMWFGARS